MASQEKDETNREEDENYPVSVCLFSNMHMMITTLKTQQAL